PDRRRAPLEIAHVLAVEVDVDEAVQVALGRQELVLERGVRRDETVDDFADRPAADLDLLRPTEARPQDAGHLHHAHRTPPRVNTPESDASAGAVPAARAATALSEQAGHSGSRFRRSSVNEVSSAS